MPYYTDKIIAVYRKGNIVYRVYNALEHIKLGAQVAYIQQVLILAFVWHACLLLSLLFQPGIQFIAQEIAKQVDAENQQHNIQPRKYRHPPKAAKEHVETIFHQQSQRRLRNGNAHAQEAQRRLGQNEVARLQRAQDDHGGDHVRQHVADHDLKAL